MRRATSVWRGSDGLWYPDPQPDSQRLFVDHPKRQDLIDRYNAMATNQTASFIFTDPSATFPGYDAGGNPVEIPGTVVAPGDPIVISYFSVADLLFAFQFITVSFDYNAETNGDGPGAIISADGQRSSTKKSDTGGAANLVQNFLQLMNHLIDTLPRRESLVVKDLLNRFASGQMSITQVLAELEREFILT